MKKEGKVYILEWAIDIAVAAIIVYIITRFAFQNMYVVGNSMDPTLKNGEAVLVNKLTYLLINPSRHDIIAFKHINGTEEEMSFVKRIIGIPGDKIDIINHIIYVNDEILEIPTEEYMKDNSMKKGNMSYPIVVPEDSYFVLGDNKKNSIDSRYLEIGMIPKTDLIGKIIMRIWPLWKPQIF